MSKAVESDEGDDYEDDEFDDFSGDNEEESPVVKNTDVSSIVEISPHFFVCQIADLKRNMAEDNKAALAKSKSAEKKSKAIVAPSAKQAVAFSNTPTTSLFLTFHD